MKALKSNDLSSSMFDGIDGDVVAAFFKPEDFVDAFFTHAWESPGQETQNYYGRVIEEKVRAHTLVIA